MTDKKFEELLKEAVEQCVEKEWEEISQKSKKIRYKPSKEFEEKMEKLYQKESCQNNFIGDEQTKSKSQLKDTKSEKSSKKSNYCRIKANNNYFCYYMYNCSFYLFGYVCNYIRYGYT